jgi:hypothetical protein
MEWSPLIGQDGRWNRDLSIKNIMIYNIIKVGLNILNGLGVNVKVVEKKHLCL